MGMIPHYNLTFVGLSFLVAIFASYVALNLAGTVIRARGRARLIWLMMGSLAMGIGIWSMHFIGMEAFEMPGMEMAYDLPRMLLSVVIAVFGSGIALQIVSHKKVSNAVIFVGGVVMAAAISGMHYTGMYSMHMAAKIIWNPWLVLLSIFIALIASFAALLIKIRLRESVAPYRKTAAAIFMGIAIAGMHYTGMFAATFVHSYDAVADNTWLIQSEGLRAPISISAVLILGLALAGSVLDRMFAAKIKTAEENERLLGQARLAISKFQEERSLRERFVSALAHDLRTPLTAAKMAAELTALQRSDPRTIELASRTIDNLKRMDAMIEDLLDVHRVSAGEALPIRREICDLDILATDVISHLTMIYGDRFVLSKPGPVLVNWDFKYIARAIENLCTNAVKYGSDIEKIRVSIENLPNSFAAVSVNNKGPVLNEEEHQKLFSVFRRGKVAESSMQKGWGIGLTIVKGIVEAHGGEIYVESNPNSGTTFRFVCPTALLFEDIRPPQPSSSHLRSASLN
jgi:NO-binding membrane sensor protein with MHYT domain/nitrogen-specific signal transduction histidine kinase